MGDLTKKYPKNLLKIKNNERIIDLQINQILKAKISQIFFPAGYKFSILKNYIKRKYKSKNYIVKNTGVNTTISKRIKKILNLIDNKSNIILLNGDTIFDIDLKKILNNHIKSKKKITISTYSFKSNFGLIKIKKNTPKKFVKNIKMKKIQDAQNNSYLINAGITIINKSFLNNFNYEHEDFEETLFNQAINKKQLNLFTINKKLYQFDTQKDVENYKSKLK